MDLYLNENYIRIEAKTVPEKVYLKKLFDYKKTITIDYNEKHGEVYIGG